MERLKVLLPPSESKASGGDGPIYVPAAGVFGGLARPREKVRKGLRRRDFDAIAHLGVKGSALEAAMLANAHLATAPTMPALRRYTGVLYGALAYDSLPADLRRCLGRDVLIVSGLLGLVGGADPVPNYKAPIGAVVPALGRLATFWKPQLTAALRIALADAVVWDLLPTAHSTAAPVTSAATHWRVRVLRETGGRRITVSHDNKAVKGALTRALVAQQIVHPAELANWQGPGGYRVAGYTVPSGRSPGVVEVVTVDVRGASASLAA